MAYDEARTFIVEEVEVVVAVVEADDEAFGVVLAAVEDGNVCLFDLLYV